MTALLELTNKVTNTEMAKYTKEVLEAAVKSSSNLTQVLKALGVVNYSGGGMSNHIHFMIKKFEISTAHFLWGRHNSGPKHKGGSAKRSAESFFVDRPITERRAEGKRLKRALIEVGVPYECSECGITAWNSKPITLEVDHINGKRTDDRKENLRFLCPNCHSQAPVA